eukprot:1681230-Amphidinium_carterae.3
MALSYVPRVFPMLSRAKHGALSSWLAGRSGCDPWLPRLEGGQPLSMIQLLVPPLVVRFKVQLTPVELGRHSFVQPCGPVRLVHPGALLARVVAGSFGFANAQNKHAHTLAHAIP